MSNDAALRIKAAHLGVDAAEHRRSTRHPDQKSYGWSTLETGFDVVDCLYAAGAIDADAVEAGDTIGENEFAVQTFEFEGAPDIVSVESMTFEDLGNGRTRLRGHSVYPSLEARDAIVHGGWLRCAYEELECLKALQNG